MSRVPLLDPHSVPNNQSTSLSSPPFSSISSVSSFSSLWFTPFSSLSDTLYPYRHLFYTFVVAYFVARQLKWLFKLINSKHEMTILAAPDPVIFPQYIQSPVSRAWLYTYSWAVNNPSAYIFILHGKNEWAGRYTSFAHYLNKNHNISVYSMDMVGHGASQGERGYIERFEEYIKDYSLFIEKTTTNLPPRPAFLFGHSMGGLVAVQLMRILWKNKADLPSDHYLSTISCKPAFPFSGLILSSAAILPDPNVASPSLRLLSRLLSNWLPKFAPVKIEESTLSHIPQVIEHYHADPMCSVEPMHVRWGAEMLKNMDDVQQYADTLTFPLLIFHGTWDRITAFEGSRIVAEKLKGKGRDVTFKVYENGAHEMLHDIERETVMKDIGKWLDEKIGRQPNQ